VVQSPAISNKAPLGLENKMTNTLIINGKQKQFSDHKLPGTLGELLETMNIQAATVAAEIDGRIIERKNFADTNLQPGQSIELIRFVGGGSRHG